MTEREISRLSIIDGALESSTQKTNLPRSKKIVPVFEEFIAQVATIEGIEEVVKKRVSGFKEEE